MAASTKILFNNYSIAEKTRFEPTSDSQWIIRKGNYKQDDVELWFSDIVSLTFTRTAQNMVYCDVSSVTFPVAFATIAHIDASPREPNLWATVWGVTSTKCNVRFFRGATLSTAVEFTYSLYVYGLTEL